MLLAPSKVSFIFLATCLLFACTGDDDTNDPPIVGDVLPELLTSAPDITGPQIQFQGEIVSAGTVTIFSRGFVYSQNANPTVADNRVSADGSGVGAYESMVTRLEPDTEYNVRAYVACSGGDVYGNNISFRTGSPVVFSDLVISNIESARATISGRVNENGAGISSRGIVWHTSANPTFEDLVYNAGSGEGEIEIDIIELEPDTEYFIRSFSVVFGETYFGEELVFKTVGYRGPAGGYVVLDKGNDDDGWQYLEISPEGSIFLNWGCAGTSVGSISSELGDGPANTATILANCSSSNTAAQACDRYALNGFDDWFLPSSGELVRCFRSLFTINSQLAPGNYLMSSTEVNANEYEEVYLNSGDSRVEFVSKSTNAECVPVRRF